MNDTNGSGKMLKKQISGMRKKNRKHKRKASEGMTAAIILIAFIITAAGIAFVVLTMGQGMQIELGNVGSEGKDSASSAVQVEGGIVTGYSATGSTVTAYIFNLRLVLSTGEVDLASGSMEAWILVGSNTEARIVYNATQDSVAEARANNVTHYGIEWLDGSGDVLDPNEMARFYISTTDALGASSSTEVSIIINSNVASIIIQKTIPVGLVTGLNFL